MAVAGGKVIYDFGNLFYGDRKTKLKRQPSQVSPQLIRTDDDDEGFKFPYDEPHPECVCDGAPILHQCFESPKWRDQNRVIKFSVNPAKRRSFTAV